MERRFFGHLQVSAEDKGGGPGPRRGWRPDAQPEPPTRARPAPRLPERLRSAPPPLPRPAPPRVSCAEQGWRGVRERGGRAGLWLT